MATMPKVKTELKASKPLCDLVEEYGQCCNACGQNGDTLDQATNEAHQIDMEKSKQKLLTKIAKLEQTIKELRKAAK